MENIFYQTKNNLQAYIVAEKKYLTRVSIDTHKPFIQISKKIY